MSVDYARAKREHPKQKAALTRAVKSRDPERVKAACKAAVAAWETWGPGPTTGRAGNALDDVQPQPWRSNVRLEDLG